MALYKSVYYYYYYYYYVRDGRCTGSGGMVLWGGQMSGGISGGGQWGGRQDCATVA